MSPTYFRYLPPPQNASIWGAAITAAGFSRVPPGDAYPSHAHPEDHTLGWKKGRVLQTFQIVLIEGGKGIFESKPTGLRPVFADTAFMLFPGVWHRYQPENDTGWTESWIEITGPLAEKLRQEKLLSPQLPIVRGSFLQELKQILDEVHRRVQQENPGPDDELCALAVQAMAKWISASREREEVGPNQRAIMRSEAWLREHLHEPVEFGTLARTVGMSYSNFRRIFRLQTGMAPGQYLTAMRLERARRLISEQDLVLYDIAERVGFSSPFHLSAAFKAHFGISPNVWRREQREGCRVQEFTKAG